MIIDQFLALAEAQGASALTIRAGAPPQLDRRGSKFALSMPSLDVETFTMILEEVTTVEQRELLTTGDGLELEYRSADGKRFSVTIAGAGADARLTFKPATGPVASKPAPSSPAPATAHAATAHAAREPAAAPRVATDSATITRILARAQIEAASDVLMPAGLPARLRQGGALVELEQSVDAEELAAYFEAPLSAAARAQLELRGSIDLALVAEGSRWRANIFRTHRGLSIALRPIRTDVPNLVDLHLPADFAELTDYRTGLVLVTGMAGAGKSTTVAALVEHVNRTAAKHIITLEDPIEYEFTSARALVQQREIGRDVIDFSTGLRAALRESPDVILLGEMRDHETIAAALTAAETGHLVLGTLHAGSAAMAIDRIVDVFPEHQQAQVRVQLAAVLRAVVTQVLLPSTRPPARWVAYEKLLVTTAVAAKIRELRGHQIQSEIQKGRAEGMVSFELSLSRLVRTGRVEMDVALTLASDRKLLAELVGGA
jgi:twitching motility protein PilT